MEIISGYSNDGGIEINRQNLNISVIMFRIQGKGQHHNTRTTDKVF
jgi:hypothetical protein